MRGFSPPPTAAKEVPGALLEQLKPNGCLVMPSAELARGISPRAAHRTGLESLDSSGSCHPQKTAVFHRHQQAPPISVGPSMSARVTRPLRSIPITGISSLLRGSPPLPAASVLSASWFLPLAPFPLASTDRFSSS